MSIYLIRHGQTNGNRDRILQTPDTPLSELGHQQAQHLAHALADIDISHVLCSDYTRTQQTAKPIQQRTNAPLSLEPLLRERSFGDIRGRAYDDINVDFFHRDYKPPNGETYQQFAKRVSHAWEAILRKYNQVQGNLVVMTHGLVLRELIDVHLHVTNNVKPLSDFQNTSITQIDCSDEYRVVRLCDARHLGNYLPKGAAV